MSFQSRETYCDALLTDLKVSGPARIRPPPLAANGRILLRTKAELGHEAGEIKVLVNFCDLSALELEHPGHLHAEGVARRRDCLSAGTEQRSLVRPRAGGL